MSAGGTAAGPERARDDATRREAGIREAALDPAASFIVEAPAGSGKTELLTQRFLSLLTCVELPEQIVAITFTRKAAAEMRQRVVDTLRAAAAPGSTVPAHRRRSLELAGEVLQRSDRLGWSLLEQCQRLRILTIDALNTSLARQLPVLASGVLGVTITDDAEPLYREAARRTTEALAESGELGTALGQLLALADNSLARLEGQLAEALPQRDRWIRELAGMQPDELAGSAQRGISRIWQDRLTALREAAGPELERALFDLLDRRKLPVAGDSSAARWSQAAALLLTSAGDWRQRFTRREGFPPGEDELRSALEAVLEACRATAGLKSRLAAIAELPDEQLGSLQHEALAALAPVLTHLLAELRVLFAERETVDHTELALAAQQALGAVDAPSDLLLALDRRIEHILVDEFQDTSHLQWGLLERLTAGWENDDGRTLFLVGDPMQSIYRFRDADLSLFSRARERGIGEIRLRHIELAVNHRSAAELVDWVNTTFAAVMRAGDLPASVRPGFRTAVSGRGSDGAAGVELHAIDAGSNGSEIERIVAIVSREAAARPGDSIGILVRSRSHLRGLRSALASAGLPAHAVEIDSLADTQFGQDLLALTQALAHRADRLAWLGVLRSRWCGITWADLHALVAGESDRTIPDLLEDAAAVGRMSSDGAERAVWLRDRLVQGRARRAALGFGRWVRDCWLLLDGPACLDGQDALDAAERYFLDLEALARNGDLDDPAVLQSRFARPAQSADPPAESGIEIMTIHRAKGLEFDTVVLPGLSRTTRGNQARLLMLQDFILSSGSTVGLLAAAVPDDPLSRFLLRLERDQEAEERERLLYVAATRARRRLHLLATHTGDAPPRSGSLLATLWPGVGDRFASATATSLPRPETRTANMEPDLVALPLWRLRLDRDLPAPALEPAPGGSSRFRPEFEWVHPASVQVGTLIHRELQRLTQQSQSRGHAVAPAISIASYRRELALLGVDAPDLEDAARRVAEALERVWSDPRGRWILAPRAEAWSELRLVRVSRNRLEHLMLDRSFVTADGCRWIIDYKTGRHLGADVEQFLDSEVERYRDQLERYAEAVAASDPRPIRVGLYFPLMQRLKDWTPSASVGR